MNTAVPLHRQFGCFLSLLLLWTCIPARGDSRPRADVDVVVPVLPFPIRADGHFHLAYELHLTNFGNQDLNLWRLEITSDDPAAFPLGRYEGPELLDRIARPGQPMNLENKQRIGPGLRAVLFIWLTIDARSALPRSLIHRFTFAQGESPKSVTEIVEEIPGIRMGPPPRMISSPLRGSQWLAANGPSNTSLHRRALIPVEGRAAISQRFAIDWVKLGEDGRTWYDDRLKNSSYHAYGAEILAVADGTVASTKDSIPENTPGSRAVPITLDTVAGNYVILDLGAGMFAFYAHIQPGSIRVKRGDRVQRGQMLGLVGNSGNSTEPHLHFHVGDSNSPLGAEGLPYLLDTFELQGRGLTWKPSESVAEERRGELPLQNTVVKFKDPPPQTVLTTIAAEAKPEDVASIDAIVAALYDTISGPANKKRDWGRFRSLFAPGARLIPTGQAKSGGFEAQVRDVEAYITASGPYLEKNGFFEREIGRRTEGFGHIAHVFSTYESRHKPEDPKPFARGINSIQLVNDGRRWWVVTIFWEAERPETPLPKKYLKR